jgi:hypothetical protein
VEQKAFKECKKKNISPFVPHETNDISDQVFLRQIFSTWNKNQRDMFSRTISVTLYSTWNIYLDERLSLLYLYLFHVKLQIKTGCICAEMFHVEPFSGIRRL